MIKGLIAPILSPFDDNLDFNQELYNQLAKKLLETGCSGLAPFGTTGEALSVSNSERKSALEGLVKFGIDPLKLIPGTGLCNLPDTIDLCRHALGLGCKGVMTLPPFYFKGMSDDGLHDYYVKLIEGINDTNLKIYLYHIPQVSGVGLSIDLVRNLHTEFPDTIVGIKDSSGDWENTKALLGIKGLIVYPGAELPVIDAIRLGAPGCISATANVNPAAIDHLYQTWEADDAETQQAALNAIRNTVMAYPMIPALKATVAEFSRDEQWQTVRPPLINLDPEKSAALMAGLRGMNFEMPGL